MDIAIMVMILLFMFWEVSKTIYWHWNNKKGKSDV